MQWQQTLKEGPGCNQLLQSALGHLRIQKSVTMHCITQNSKEEFSSSGLQVSQGQQI